MKKKKSQAWQFDGSAPPAWGMGRGARRDCPGCSPTVVGGLSGRFPVVTAACRAACYSSLAAPASLSGLAETMCSTRMTPDSIWFCHFKNFPPPIWLLWSLQKTDWENRLLEKHLQVVLKGWLPHQAAGKACKVPPAGPKACTLFPPTPKTGGGARDHKRCGRKVTCSTTVRVCCFWLMGVFCFCVCSVLTKGLLPPAAWKLLNSVLDHFILLKPFQQNGQNHQLVAGVKSNSMTTFKYWLVWE